MKLMLVAGEASGDAHGRELLKELNALIPELETFGIGGKGMLEMGLRPYFMLDTMQSHGDHRTSIPPSQALSNASLDAGSLRVRKA